MIFVALSELGFLGLEGDFWDSGVVVWGFAVRESFWPLLPGPSHRPSPAERERGFCWWLMAVFSWWLGCGVMGWFWVGSLSFCEGALRFLRGAWAVHERPLRGGGSGVHEEGLWDGGTGVLGRGLWDAAVSLRGAVWLGSPSGPSPAYPAR